MTRMESKSYENQLRKYNSKQKQKKHFFPV